MNIFKKKLTKDVDKRNRSLKKASVISTIIFLVVILTFNILFDRILGSSLKWDWSTGEQYTIGEVSQGILSNMTADVQIIGLFDQQSDQYFQKIQLLLEDYSQKSNSRITVRYVDPDKNPGILTEVDPDDYLKLKANSFVVYCPSTKKAKAVIDSDIFDIQYDPQTYQQYIAGVTAEQSFTGAIKYVQSETTPAVYFTAGHDEIDYTTVYSSLVSVMQNNNFEVKSLNMFGLDKIPDDCATLIMAAPAKDINAAEREVINTYLKGGGGLMVIASYSNSEYPELNKLLADFNLEVSNNKIREGDVDHQFNNDAYTLRAIAPVSKLTEQAYDGVTLMDNVRGMNILANAKEYVETAPILTTSDKGVAETKADPDVSSTPGTQNIAVISEYFGAMESSTSKSAKVMLVGSSSIFSDSILQSFGDQIYNIYIFYYGLNWLSASDMSNDVLIEAKAPVTYALSTGTQSSYNFTAILVMIILPLALLLAALLVYRKRKHL